MWALVLLLLVDTLVLATFLPGIADASAPLWTRVVSVLVVLFALFLGGLTLTRLVRRAIEQAKIGT
ncbi:hypothetical protein GCM10027026_04740 [Myroides odoratimimus subsp. xuanwuensis]